jgi:hypothetical protein
MCGEDCNKRKYQSERRLKYHNIVQYINFNNILDVII